MSLARQNYEANVEEALNQQINMELKASHIYLSIHAYFARDSVSLPGLAKFFKDSSDEEREHAQKMIDYQLQRGGKVTLQTITAPEIEWGSAKNAVEFTLNLEKEVNKALLQLHAFADAATDPQFCDFIESNFLVEQVEAQKELADMLTQLVRVGADGLGLYLWDQELLKKH
ncbi:ferritin-like superfamily [Blastocladiella britannica]|nr:ferritin-like superfamily [Blastocladiella britannica]